MLRAQQSHTQSRKKQWEVPRGAGAHTSAWIAQVGDGCVEGASVLSASSASPQQLSQPELSLCSRLGSVPLGDTAAEGGLWLFWGAG